MTVAEPEIRADIVVLRWPAERTARDRLAREGKPRLLLVAPDSDPPEGQDCLEDWIRFPADDRDVAARLRALELRASHHQSRPETDDCGRLTFNGNWVALSPIEQRLVTALANRFGEVVSREELLAAGWPNEKPSDTALRVHLTRLRKELEPLHLQIATVRGFGHVMQEAPVGPAAAASYASSR
ncbi:MAG: winged helix-turn-helix domain-containing protein [Acidimicrobiia bacterium]|nr:winged helix-turn-helix domain-containing protein [Acidimicrobiia bacterium]